MKHTETLQYLRLKIEKELGTKDQTIIKKELNKRLNNLSSFEFEVYELYFKFENSTAKSAVMKYGSEILAIFPNDYDVIYKICYLNNQESGEKVLLENLKKVQDRCMSWVLSSGLYGENFELVKEQPLILEHKPLIRILSSVGILYSAVGDFENAISNYQLVLKLSPIDDTNIISRLNCAYFATNQLEKIKKPKMKYNIDTLRSIIMSSIYSYKNIDNGLFAEKLLNKNIFFCYLISGRYFPSSRGYISTDLNEPNYEGTIEEAIKAYGGLVKYMGKDALKSLADNIFKNHKDFSIYDYYSKDLVTLLKLAYKFLLYCFMYDQKFNVDEFIDIVTTDTKSSEKLFNYEVKDFYNKPRNEVEELFNSLLKLNLIGENCHVDAFTASGIVLLEITDLEKDI